MFVQETYVVYQIFLEEAEKFQIVLLEQQAENLELYHDVLESLDLKKTREKQNIISEPYLISEMFKIHNISYLENLEIFKWS